jgi:hypothetical protein
MTSPNWLTSHWSGEAGEALVAGEKLLHSGLFELALLSDELFKRFNEEIRVAQGLSNGFLFDFGRRAVDSYRGMTTRN